MTGSIPGKGPRTMPANNRKLVNYLRAGLDAAATQAALERGDITPIQARNITRWIDQVRKIHAYPLHVVQDRQGRMIGEFKAGDAGNEWVARRYGSEYDTPATFDSQEAAIAFVCGETQP